MIVLIINGAPRVGKDTFINLLSKITEKEIVAYSSIDWVKNTARQIFGWDGTKDTKSRQMLSDLKDLATKWDDIPFRCICTRIGLSLKASIDYFCTNIREPSEIQKLCDWCKTKGIPCYSIWIRRKEAEQKALDNHFFSRGDTQFTEFNYDFIIENQTTIDTFCNNILQVIQNIHEKEELQYVACM